MLLVTAALLVAALGVLSIALSGSDDDDAAEPSASGPVEAATGPQVSGGGVTVSMPAGWVGADVSAGTEGVPAQLFPDDAEVANHVASTLSFLPRAVVILGLDEESARARDPFVDNMSVLLDVSVPDGMPLDDVLDAQTAGIDAFGAEVLDSELIDLGGREVGRIQSRFAVSGFSYEAVSYIIIVDTGETYVLTFSFDDVGADDVVLADGSALTFRVG